MNLAATGAAVVLALGVLAGVSPSTARAEAELTGTAAELTAHLATLPRTVVLVGEAELKVVADTAYVTIRVTTEARNFRDALSKNVDVRDDLRKALKKAGLPDDAIVGSKFISRPTAGLFSDKARTYRIDNAIRVRVADEAQFRHVASAIDSHSEAYFEGLEFVDSQAAMSQQRALAAACDVAQAKRQMFAAKVGVKLQPIDFVENPVQVSTSTAAQTYSSVDLSSKVDAYSSLPRSATDNAAAAPGLSQFDEYTYRARVAIEYRVIPE